VLLVDLAAQELVHVRWDHEALIKPYMNFFEPAPPRRASTPDLVTARTGRCQIGSTPAEGDAGNTAASREPPQPSALQTSRTRPRLPLSERSWAGLDRFQQNIVYEQGAALLLVPLHLSARHGETDSRRSARPPVCPLTTPSSPWQSPARWRDQGESSGPLARSRRNAGAVGSA
jgi:hypothetical protein